MLSWNIFRLFEKYLYNPKTIPSGNVLQFAVETIARLLMITMVIYLFKLVIFQFTTLNYQKIMHRNLELEQKNVYQKTQKCRMATFIVGIGILLFFLGALWYLNIHYKYICIYTYIKCTILTYIYIYRYRYIYMIYIYIYIYDIYMIYIYIWYIYIYMIYTYIWYAYIRRPRPWPRQGRRLGPPQVWNFSFLAFQGRLPALNAIA